MNIKLLVFSFCLSTLGMFFSCKEHSSDPSSKPLPKVQCYNVKESKTLIFDNGALTDSAIFRFTWDSQNRIVSQQSVMDSLILEFDYTNSTKIVMNQSSTTTKKLDFVTHYLLNKLGYASWKNMYSTDGTLLNSLSYVYNIDGYRTHEYYHSGNDSSIGFNGIWQNECNTQFSIPQSETSVTAKYTTYPDNRNLGFAAFLRNKSYYLVDSEIYTSRGSSTTYSYTYKFDSLNRPLVVTVYRGSAKTEEKYYTYY